MSATQEYMTRKEAAAYISRLGIPMSMSSMNRYASEGRGPPFVRRAEGGPTFYLKSELDGWIRGLARKPGPAEARSRP